MKMAPKKTVDGKTAAATKKTPKKPKEKPLKPKLKTPSIIKVKIPIAGAKIPTNLSPKPTKPTKLTKKQLTVERKVELANEVAAAQLNKLKPVLTEVNLVQAEEPKQAKKRGRKNKTEEPVVTSADSDDAFEPASPVKRKCIRKESVRILKKKIEVGKASSGKKSLSLSLSPKKNAKVTKPKAVAKKTQKSTDAENKMLDSEPKTRKNKVNAETGKQNVGDKPVNDITSPSLLNQLEDRTDLNNANIEACPIESRKTSLNSELSWTKDISSSSTTTCFTVCSTDIVRIDKKFPILKIDNIGLKYPNETKDSSSSSSSDSETTDNKDDNETSELESKSLELSTSSVTPTKSLASMNNPENSNQNYVNVEIDKTSRALDVLTAKLKKFDLEIVNWIGYENEDSSIEVERFQQKIFQVLKEESEIIMHCQRLKSVLSDNIDIGNDDEMEAVGDVAEENEPESHKGEDIKNVEVSPKKVISPDEENNYTIDKIKYKSFDQCCDDDDALSLFAESLTGMETSTHSCAASIGNPGDFEEYVPQMVTNDRWEPANKFTYTPSNITGKPHHDVTMKARTVCEKQNADSTSIYKEMEQERYLNLSSEQPVLATNVVQNSTPKIRVPKLMSFYYKPSHGQRSDVLKGVCFFNLLSSCKKLNCIFPHNIPDRITITAKIMGLSEEKFIQEYMLLRDWPELRRKYGMCFVEECKRRDLTRILVEMARDFVMKAKENVREDSTLKIEVIECTLLHLNSVDLSLCEDLLTYNLHKGVPLCDVFMQAIANTQNFSRFKLVFIKLTNFMLSYDRSFSLEVASQILERLSILPCERPLLQALLKIVQHTDRRILENSMLGHFEKQLVAYKDLHDQLLELKKELTVNRPVMNNLYLMSPRNNREIEPVMSNALVSEREKRYTSPDTTNLDNMNKTTDDLAIAPTIEFSRAGLFGNIKRTFTNSNSSASNGSEECRQNVPPKNKPNYKSWKDMSIFNHLHMPSVMQGSPREVIARHVHHPMNFGRSPPKFPRRSGPDYY